MIRDRKEGTAVSTPLPQDVRVSSYFDHGGTTPLERA